MAALNASCLRWKENRPPIEISNRPTLSDQSGTARFYDWENFRAVPAALSAALASAGPLEAARLRRSGRVASFLNPPRVAGVARRRYPN
jgi:hypothetical protein